MHDDFFEPSTDREEVKDMKITTKIRAGVLAISPTGGGGGGRSRCC
jgi:hypothetical protein